MESKLLENKTIFKIALEHHMKKFIDNVPLYILENMDKDHNVMKVITDTVHKTLNNRMRKKYHIVKIEVYNGYDERRTDNNRIKQHINEIILSTKFKKKQLKKILTTYIQKYQNIINNTRHGNIYDESDYRCDVTNLESVLKYIFADWYHYRTPQPSKIAHEYRKIFKILIDEETLLKKFQIEISSKDKNVNELVNSKKIKMLIINTLIDTDMVKHRLILKTELSSLKIVTIKNKQTIIDICGECYNLDIEIFMTPIRVKVTRMKNLIL